MKTTKMMGLLALLAATPLLALAGKAERDFASQELEPAIKSSGEQFAKSCGCPIKFDVKQDTLPTVDDLRTARNFVRAVAEGAAGHCTDAASKAAVCKMKTLEVSRGATSDFKFSGSKGTAVIETGTYPSWAMIERQVDK